MQFTAVQYLDQQPQARLVLGDTRGHLWLFNYETAQEISSVKAHPERITGLSLKADDEGYELISSSKDSFLNVYRYSNNQNPGQECLSKSQSLKQTYLNIIYEAMYSDDRMLLLGFSGLHCFLWDTHQNLALIKVNTKGGNRPIRARYGPLSEQSSTNQA